MDHPAHSTQSLPNRPSVGLVVILVVWIFSLLVGQLGRFSLLGQGGGLLVSDIANVFVIMYAAYLSFPRKRESRALGSRVRPGMTIKLSLVSIVPFLLWSLFALLLHSSNLSSHELLIALSYWIRIATTLALLPSFFIIFRGTERNGFIQLCMRVLYGSLLAFGYAQLLIHPSLQGVGNGWDPHMFRMVGTWFDPNFFGAFLAMVLPYAIVPPRSPSRAIVGFAGLLAILLTQSRSTFLAMVCAIFVCGAIFLMSKKPSLTTKKIVSISCIVIILAGMGAAVLLGERATNLFLHDPTIGVRLEAYKAVWRNLVEPNIVLGVGYNAYQFAARDAGIISDFSIHSRAGSDSSILTLLVTTGVLGATVFITPILIAATLQARRFLVHGNIYALCFVWATVLFLVHSQFTNSLLYSHILMTYILCFVISNVYE